MAAPTPYGIRVDAGVPLDQLDTTPPPQAAPMTQGNVTDIAGRKLSDLIYGATGWRPGTTPSWVPQGLQDFSDANTAAEERSRQLSQQKVGPYGVPAAISPEQANSMMGLVGPIEAWHGSPFDFEAFARGKIGTGQGQASYGRGTAYVAEARPVAEDYKAQLSGGGERYMDTPEGRVLEHDAAEYLTPQQRALWVTAHAKGDAAQAITNAESYADSSNYARYPDSSLPNPWPETAALIRSNPDAYQGAQWKEPGHLYHVEVGAEPEHFLQWDKPLNEQSPQVRQKVHNAFGHEGTPEEHAQADAAETEAWRKVWALRDAIENPDVPSFPTAHSDLENATGDANAASDRLHELEVLHKGDLTGEDVYDRLINKVPDFRRAPIEAQQHASDALEQAGIPGIRYMDQFSRNAKPREEIENDLAEWRDELARLRGESAESRGVDPAEHRNDLQNAQERIALHEQDLANYKPPTHNYVVFSPETLRIMKQYGLAAAGLTGAGGIGAAAMPPGQAQAQPLDQEQQAQAANGRRRLIVNALGAR
ncbi:MAG TPA: hypothetical protein VGH25_07360 [Dongiaceae bacterium]